MLPLSLINVAKSKALKTVITVIIIVILLLIVWKLYQKAKKSIDEAIEQKRNQKALEKLNATNSNDPGGNIVSNAQTFTIPEYKQMADDLFKAMDGLGTDEETILKTISKLKTKADWNRLKQAYGTRKITAWGYGFNGTLLPSLKSELSNFGEPDFNEYDVNVVLHINNILSRFGEKI